MVLCVAGRAVHRGFVNCRKNCVIESLFVKLFIIIACVECIKFDRLITICNRIKSKVFDDDVIDDKTKKQKKYMKF